MSKEELTYYIAAKQREIKVLSKNRLKNIKHSRSKLPKIKKHLENFINTDTNDEYYNRIIMMPGLRGVGKTTILYQVYEYLVYEKRVNEEDILYLDVWDLKSVDTIGIKEVIELFLENFHKTDLVNLNKKIFLLIDEAQLDENWAKYAKTLFDKSYNIFMIITGSSALNLNLNTDAVRRITIENIPPCNFNEYLLLKHNIELPDNNFKDLILNCKKSIVEKSIEDEENIQKALISLNNDPEIEFKKFIHTQNFPYALELEEYEIHKSTNEIIQRIVQNDLKLYKNFNSVTNDGIIRMINYLGIKKPGSTSTSSMARALEMSTKTVNNVLNALEKTQLLFKVPAYGSAGKMLNKPSEHFFSATSMKSSINHRIGRYDLNHEKCYSVLAENLVASSLFRLINERTATAGLFYDSNKKGVDFIVKQLDEIIPVEVGIGKKTKSQLTIAKNRYNAKYGILISNRTKTIKFENGILYIPLISFALMQV